MCDLYLEREGLDQKEELDSEESIMVLCEAVRAMGKNAGKGGFTGNLTVAGN